MQTNTPDDGNLTTMEVMAVDLAQLAREIAMDILEVPQVLALHKLSDAEWQRIQENPRFQAMLTDMVREWNSAGNVYERVRVKAATGLESVLEVYIHDILDPTIPLAQRNEAGKFLANLGELGGARNVGNAGGSFHITLNIGGQSTTVDVARPLIDVTPGVIPDDDE